MRYIKFKKWKVAICRVHHLCQHPNKTYKPNPRANHLYKYENNLQTTIEEPTTFGYEERKCKPLTITFSITPWRKTYTKCEILQIDELTNSTNIQITTYKESARQSPNQRKKYRPLINLTFANLWQIQVTNLKGVEEGTFTFSFHKLYNMGKWCLCHK
jgi:hypothetical protein